MEELPDQGEGAALAGHVLVARLAPGRHVPVQLVHVEAHLGHEAASHHAVDVVRVPDVPGLHKLVQHGLGILHCPVAVNGSVGVSVLRVLHVLLVHFLQVVPLEVALARLLSPHLVSLAHGLGPKSRPEHVRSAARQP